MGLIAYLTHIAYSLHPKLGDLFLYALKIYYWDEVFWNDGIVGFMVGVPLTFWLYNFTFAMINNGLIQFLGYVGCAFLAFVVQHLLRRFWVFKTKGDKKK